MLSFYCISFCVVAAIHKYVNYSNKKCILDCFRLSSSSAFPGVFPLTVEWHTCRSRTRPPVVTISRFLQFFDFPTFHVVWVLFYNFLSLEMRTIQYMQLQYKMSQKGIFTYKQSRTHKFAQCMPLLHFLPTNALENNIIRKMAKFASEL